jgi:hypothetical protein
VQRLPWNNCVNVFPRKQTHATTEDLYFSVRSVPSGYEKDREGRLSGYVVYTDI